MLAPLWMFPGSWGALGVPRWGEHASSWGIRCSSCTKVVGDNSAELPGRVCRGWGGCRGIWGVPLAGRVGLQGSQQQCVLRAEDQQGETQTKKAGKRGRRRFWCMQVRWELWVSVGI